MHSRSESGIPLDYDALEKLRRERVQAKWQARVQRLRNLEHVNEALKMLDRQPTAEEVEAAKKLLGESNGG